MANGQAKVFQVHMLNFYPGTLVDSQLGATVCRYLLADLSTSLRFRQRAATCHLPVHRAAGEQSYGVLHTGG